MEDRKKGYEKDTSYSFDGDPEMFDVEQEISDTTEGLVYDPYRLAEILVTIGEKMTGIPLYEYQKNLAFRIIYSILSRDGAEITALFSRQSGKSEVIVFCVIVLGILLPVLSKIYPKELGYYSTGIKIGLFAPQGEQVQTVYQRCVSRLHSEPVRMFLDDPDILDAPTSTVHFRLKSGTTLTGQSAAKQSKIESKTFQLVFIDESQDVDTEKVRKSIIPMTASTFGTIVRTGTPGRYKGDFYYVIQNNKKDDKNLTTPKQRLKFQKHFEYNYKDVIRCKREQFKKDGQDFHTLYEKSVLRDRKSSGENSDYFRMSYKIEWLLDVGMFITEDRMAEKMYNKKIIFPKISEKDFVVAGLDIASARANTVLTTAILDTEVKEFGERPFKTLAGWTVLNDMNYEEQFHIIANALIEQKVRVLYADYTGVGRGLTDILMYHLGDIVDIVPYTFSPSSKSDMWKVLDEDIDNSRLTVPAHRTVRETPEFKMFEEQLLNLQKFWKGSFMVCEKTQGFKDDFCDSLALCNLAGNHLYTPTSPMEVSQNKLLGTAIRNNLKNSSRW